MAVSRETIELAHLTAIQHLPPRQRAVLILRDALDWSANETATLLETSVASVTSALQRARATMRSQLPPGRLEWAPTSAPSEKERSVLQRYMAAHDRADSAALAALLRLDVLRIEGGVIAEITTFASPKLFPTFGLPATLPLEAD